MKTHKSGETGEEKHILRVAAYCRVSADDYNQGGASVNLVAMSYKNRINANQNWKYAGTYVDEIYLGIDSGQYLSFQKLMEDALNGKVDLIFIKTAKYLKGCIEWVEKLQNHDPPIGIYCELDDFDYFISS